MADSASARFSREYATDVDWINLPPELLLEIFSYLSPVTILNEVAFVCRKFNSLKFHPFLWREIDVKNWSGPIKYLVQNHLIFILRNVHVLNLD